LKRTVKRVEVAEVSWKGRKDAGRLWRGTEVGRKEVEGGGKERKRGGRRWNGTGSLFGKNCERIIKGAKLRRKGGGKVPARDGKERK
jgi:hypothetical protein